MNKTGLDDNKLEFSDELLVAEEIFMQFKF